MTSSHPDRAIVDCLTQLTALSPDPDRAARVRAHCRTQLGRRVKPTAVIAGFVWSVLAPLVVGGVCAFYIAVLIATTWELL